MCYTVNMTALSLRQWGDLLLLLGGGIALGVGSIAFRFTVPRLDVPLEFLHLQYRLGFIYLGVLLLLLKNSNTQSGRIGIAVLSLFLGLGLLVPPSLDLTVIVESVLYLALVLSVGLLHERFNSSSNTWLVVLAIVFGLEFYVYGVSYALLALGETGLRPPLFGILLMSVMLVGYLLVLGREIDKVHDGTITARFLGTVLYDLPRQVRT